MGADGFALAQQVQDRQTRLEADRERLRLVKEEATRRAEEHVVNMSVAEREKEMRDFEKALVTVLPAFESGDQAKLDAALAEVGVEPILLSEFAYVLGAHEAVYDVWGRSLEVKQGNRQSDSAAEQEIARLMETGLDRNTAINIADGVWVTSQNPQTGEVQIIDKATGRPVAAQQAQLAPQPEAAPGAVPELSFGDPAASAQPADSQFGEQFTDSNRAFGLEGFARGGVNTVSDALGFGQPFPETAATQRDFGVVRETLTNMIAQSYPRQPAQRLLRQIQDLLPAPGIPWAGPDDAREKLAALGRSLESERASVEGQLRTRKMRPNVKQQLEGQIAVLEQALTLVSSAYGSFGSAETPALDQSDIELMSRLLSDG